MSQSPLPPVVPETTVDDDPARALPGDDLAGRQHLPTRTTTYWRVHAVIVGVLVVGVVTAGAITLDWFTPLIRWLIAGLLAAYYFVAQALIAPPIRRRVFWFAVSQDEIDLQHGLIVKTRTVIPMNRVQHLKMEHGPIADRFYLASLHIHTAAGTIPMHGLDAGVADEVRRRIGRLAGLADDV